MATVRLQPGNGPKGVATAYAAAKASERPSRSTAVKKNHAAPPQFISPQLATLVTAPPEGEEWVHEIKYDGYRAVAAIGGETCHIYTRSGQDWTHKFQSIATALLSLRVSSALLDGEIVALDPEGRSRFQLLQNGLRQSHAPLTYYVFDLLELDGKDLRAEPLRERKEILRKLLKGAPDAIRYSADIAGHGQDVLSECCRLGLEGIISKRADKPYVSARSMGWLKSKCLGNDEFVIGGYRVSDKKGRPFASLLLGEFVDGELHYRGRVGTGFDTAMLDQLGAKLHRLERKTSPFVDAPREVLRDARWVKPELVAQIAFTERTADGILRHPAFLGLRGDKPAREVQTPMARSATQAAVKKTPATKAPAKKDPPTKRPPQKAPGRKTTPIKAPRKSSVKDAPESTDGSIAGVKLTHPQRVLFPDEGITKLDLAAYFFAASGRMLPFVQERPLSIVRCPEGVADQCFFQKHTKKGLPGALKSVPVTESDGTTAQYLMLDDAAGLVAVAQIGGIEIHPWGATADDLEHAERLIFDLDPDPSVPFSAVAEAAIDIRKLLQTAGLTSFALLTGGKGVHVIAPLDQSQDWETVKGFARGFATKLADSEPQRFTATMSKAKRRGRIFIDWLRNERGATAIAPYSPRARATASVAAPVTWSELLKIDAANAFSIPTMLQRLQKNSDPWAKYTTTRQHISEQALSFFA
ncbi:DNA ligase D [Hyphomicrobium sulfonivorans]|uniref:DNA ligase D n=1 Tax=Hyphomicrobium sulfonivorans TaxID=121290 RepID=UPI00157147BE|nr:DNA ligase D [Hyphomicrobium sulfonivorans]MBI1649607.1 DNA ligase D [Hyphomicrobium sulfonivorans]NSL71522.1 DNA ligase D [Hyphomicrobium sulfonivorans]